MGKVGEAVEEEKKETKKREPQKSIPELLGDLESTEDQNEKRKIRARLRAAGHTGGLRQEKKGKDEKKEKNGGEKKGKRAK